MRFPDDPELINAALRINLLFREAGRSPSEDWCSPIWMGRYLWDRFLGLDHETSIRKHEAELREALGLDSSAIASQSSAQGVAPLSPPPPDIEVVSAADLPPARFPDDPELVN